MKSLIAISTALIMGLLVASSAGAEDAKPKSPPALGDGWYLSLAGGVGQNRGSPFSAPVDYTISDEDNVHDGVLKFDRGGVVLGAVGKSFGQFRTEIELGQRRTNADTMHALVENGEPVAAQDRTQDLHVRVKTTSLMANLVYDFETGSKFTPFTMVGLGYAHHSFNNGEYIATGMNDTPSSYDNAFAIQAGAGFAYKVTDYISLSTQYRFFRTSGANVSACRSNDPDCASGRVNQKTDFNHHAVLVGVTFAIKRH